LVRKICSNCKDEYEPSAGVRKIVESFGASVDKYYHGLGCGKCRSTGFAGRIAIHELFVPTDEIKEMIGEGASLRKLREKALEAGMIPLVMDGIDKVKAGIVSIEEVLRISYAGDSS
jgi:type IV pilus assembly protein PilB